MNHSLSQKEYLESLTEAAKDGDRDAFSDLFQELWTPISQYIARRVNPEDHEDLLSDIFLKMAEHLPKYSVRQGGIRAWVFRIAHNHIVDYYRTRKPLIFLGEMEDSDPYTFRLRSTEPNPSEETDQSFSQENIQKMLQRLSPTHREVLELKFIEDFSTYEIGKVMGKTEGNVRILQMRALRKAREEWEKITQTKDPKTFPETPPPAAE